MLPSADYRLIIAMRNASNSTLVNRSLAMRSAAYTASKGTYDGVEYLIVPLIPLIPGIAIQAMQAPNPELITAEVITDTLTEWLGRPTISMHPANGLSANDVSLGGLVLGRIDNPRLTSNGSLQIDAWINPVKAAAIGGDSAALVDRINAGEEIEVSVGAAVWIDMSQKGTDSNGVKYIGAWVHLAPDHVALLPSDRVGACSVEVGCGVREAVSVNVSESTPAPRALGGHMRGSLAQLRRAFGFTPGVPADNRTGSKTVSSKTIDRLLRKAASEAESGNYCWVCEFWDDRFVYEVYADDGEAYYQRGYALDESGPSVTISAERTEVTTSEPKWVAVEPETPESSTVPNPPVTAAESVPVTETASAAEPCACKGDRAMSEQSKPQDVKVTETPVTPAPTVPTTPAETPANPASTRAADGGSAIDPTGSTVMISTAELASLRSLAAREESRLAAERNQLITTARDLSTRAGSVIADAALNSMSTEALASVVATLDKALPGTRAASVSAPVNFSFQGGVGAASSTEQKTIPTPDLVGAARAMYGKGTGAIDASTTN